MEARDFPVAATRQLANPLPDLNKLLALRSNERLLFYGIGNLIRQDDGLGIRFIEELEKLSLPSWVSLEANYQLNAEDALILAEFDVVVFVDASIRQGENADLISERDAAGFLIEPVVPSRQLTFSTHAMSVGSVLALCHELSEKVPRTFLLTLSGFVWGLGEGLSQPAQENLEVSLRAVQECCQNRDKTNA